ncbi:hypothetical protein LSH36_12g17010 [Paralvinella palmiformis]|uniref:Reverse transcriptase domain-containing protein n=1 Tax=Paralvinella palmiformis TaxID=53620 RepID=A0AAD9KCE7_9ANNE|nr:hypothetical protein LSH36_12g17010 [Paralvinella palmiformis]
MGRGGDLDAVYLDFSKCFDSVPHERLLLKIQNYGIQGKMWSWSADFLRSQKQRISIEGCQSTVVMVLSGIPQGSVIGPLLFIIFVNEMPELVHTSILIFADDTKVFTEIRNEEDATKLQENLTALQEWSQMWQLRFNPDKCHVLHLGSNNQKYNMNKSTDEQTRLQETLAEGKMFSAILDTQHCRVQPNKSKTKSAEIGSIDMRASKISEHCPGVTTVFRDPSTNIVHECSQVCYYNDIDSSPYDCPELCPVTSISMSNMMEGKSDNNKFTQINQHSENTLESKPMLPLTSSV